MNDGIAYFSYPFHMSNDNYLIAFSVLSSTYGLMHLDKTLNKNLSINSKQTLNGDFWDIPTYYGIVQYMNIGALSIYSAGLLTRNDEIRKFGRIIFQSLSYTGISVMMLRIIAGRERPYSGKDQFAFTWFNLKDDVQSFPSGHTTVAFAVSSAIAEYYDNWWLRIGLYGIASLTAYARIRNNQHWFSDVFFASLLGISGGLHTAHQERIREYKAEESNFRVIPSFNNITFRYKLN